MLTVQLYLLFSLALDSECLKFQSSAASHYHLNFENFDSK